MAKRKTIDLYEIQANYGYGDGWEYECAEYTRADAKERLKEYRINAPQYQYRCISRREHVSAGAVSDLVEITKSGGELAKFQAGYILAHLEIPTEQVNTV